MGISHQYLSNLLSPNPRNVPSRDLVVRLASALGVRIDDIIEDLGISSFNSPFVFIPKYFISGGMGNGVEVVNEERGEPYAFRSEWLRKKGNPQNMVIIKASGDSMEPTIYDGDSVLVDKSKKQILSGRIYAFRSDNEIFIKRLRRIEGNRIEVTSDNDRFHKPYEINLEAGNIEIIGQVIWIGRELVK